jgi:hypothetical protein
VRTRRHWRALGCSLPRSRELHQQSTLLGTTRQPLSLLLAVGEAESDIQCTLQQPLKQQQEPRWLLLPPLVQPILLQLLTRPRLVWQPGG